MGDEGEQEEGGGEHFDLAIGGDGDFDVGGVEYEEEGGGGGGRAMEEREQKPVTEKAAQGVEGEIDEAVAGVFQTEQLAFGVEEGEGERAIEAALVEGAPVVFAPELGGGGDVGGAESVLDEDAVVADSLVIDGLGVGYPDGQEDEQEGEPAIR